MNALNKEKILMLRKKYIGPLIMLFFLLSALIINKNYLYSMLIIIGLYSITAQGLGILMGYAGQISFGYAAFFGLGAYAVAILTTRFEWIPLLALGAGALLPGAIAALIGRQTLKLRGHYLVLATLGFGILVHIIFSEGGELTGGPSGLSGIPHLSLGGLVIDSDKKFFVLVWILLVLLLLCIHNLVHSRMGRALRAIRESEYAAENAGIDCASIKQKAFIFSALLAGLAGGLYAFYVTFISPSPFGFHTSIQFVLMVIIGGLGTFWGPLAGTMLIVVLSEVLREVIPLLIPGAGGEYQIIFYGLILCGIMIYQPEGLSGLAKINLRKKIIKER